MAEVIPSDIVLVPGRYLLRPDDATSCMADVYGHPDNWGKFAPSFSTKRSTDGTPGTPPDPGIPGETVEYTRVVFNRNAAQVVSIDGVNYCLVNCDDILAFIPPE